jgi:micrococcal nuclease
MSPMQPPLNRVLLSILLAVLLVLAGCASGTDSLSTSTDTQTPTLTPVRDSAEHFSIETTNAIRTEDGSFEDFTLSITADTRLSSADLTGNPEPYLTIAFDDTEVYRSEILAVQKSLTTNVPLQEAIGNYGGGNVSMTVTLWDEDISSDDELSSTTTTLTLASIPSSTAETSADEPASTPQTESSTGSSETEQSSVDQPNTPQTTSPTQTSTRTTTKTPTPTPTKTLTPTSTATPTQSGPATGTEWTVTVTRVIDGDTMEVRFPNGETDTVRLLGVDTPETTLSRVSPDEFEGIPDTTAGRDHLYNWGQKATQFAEAELDGTVVRITVDGQADRRGYYGRLLVYIYVDGENFNKRLLTDGYARMYDSSFAQRNEFRASESTAQRTSTGLWDFEATSTPTDTPANEESDSPSNDIPPLPADGDYDCSHFDTQKQAQQVLNEFSGDPHRLDGDSDGIACESLP